MLIDCDNNLIAEWRTIEEVLPYPQYKAGTREYDNPVNSQAHPTNSNPVLRLDFDIVNKEGFGLKKGFYEIATDEEYNFLMFVEQGRIKAKIPVLKYEQISRFGTDYEWQDDKDRSMPNNGSYNIEDGIKVSSRKIYKPEYSEKEQKRREKKYKKGQDPSLYFHSKAYLEYDFESGVYKLIFEKYNTRIIGIIKL